jgi:Carboxypeptidase regulatory-like domain
MKLWTVALLSVVVLSGPASGADKKSADKKKELAYSVIAGTVFLESGFALPGASVILNVKNPSAGRKFKPLEAVSDARGEFAFRVPPVPADFTVRASMKGFQSIEKEAAISAPGERNEVTLVLTKESKSTPGESK